MMGQRPCKRGPGKGWLALLGTTMLASLLTLARMGASSSGAGSSGSDGLGSAATAAKPGALGLARAPVAAKLEELLDRSPVLGPCHKGQPLLEALPEHACAALGVCMWSEAARVNIDTAGTALEPSAAFPGATPHANCSLPRGGQGPVPEGLPPQVTLVMVVRNGSSPATAPRALLEVFLTAGEAESAEFVLLIVGSGNKTMAPAVQAARQLQQLFGISLDIQEAPDLASAQEQALRSARGEFVALIDSNTFVLRGWLGAALATFGQHPRAAAVGPLLLGGGNAVQDAGGILDSEGRPDAFGRGQRVSPELADIVFTREVDFLAPDCVVLRAAAVRELGGFDEQFRTARLRAADFALSARAAGWRVLLQPLAVGFSQGGGSFASPAGEEADRQRLVEKWGAQLAGKHCASGGDAVAAALRHTSPRLLWIDDTPPESDKDSGSVRSLNLLRILLGEGYHVTMLSTHASTHLRYPARMRHMGVRLLPKMDPALWPLAPGGACAFDLALVARRDVYLAAQEQLAKQCPGLPIVYDTVDLHFLREARDAMTAEHQSSQSGVGRGWGAALNLTTAAVAEWLRGGGEAAAAANAARNIELRLVEGSALSVVVSPDEVDMIRRYRPKARLAVVSNVHAVGPPPPRGTCAGRSGLLFVGNMNHPPNRQALEALVLDVLPRLPRLLPWRQRLGFKLHVVASNTVPDDLAALLRQHSARVVFHGYLPDDQLLELYSRVKAAVAPLLSGAGVKGKVNQAMKLGVPVVATPLAVEGAFAEDGRDCLVASDPQEFAAKVVQVYTDCELWGRLAEGGFRNVQRHFSIEAGRPALLQALNSIGLGPVHHFHRDACLPLAEKQGRAFSTA